MMEWQTISLTEDEDNKRVTKINFNVAVERLAKRMGRQKAQQWLWKRMRDGRVKAFIGKRKIPAAVWDNYELDEERGRIERK